jgi:hypothetical protein
VSLSIRQGRPARRPDVWLRQAGKENALFDPASGALHLMNDTALAIWDLCDGETTPDEMIVAIVDISRLPQEIVAEDVGRILNDFERVGIIEWKEGTE